MQLLAAQSHSRASSRPPLRVRHGRLELLKGAESSCVEQPAVFAMERVFGGRGRGCANIAANPGVATHFLAVAVPIEGSDEKSERAAPP